MLEVIKGLISSDISELYQGEFTNLVKDALNCVHAKQQEKLRRQQEEWELQAKKLADAIYQKNRKLFLKNRRMKKNSMKHYINLKYRKRKNSLRNGKF